MRRENYTEWHQFLGAEGGLLWVSPDDYMTFALRSNVATCKQCNTAG